MLTRGGLCAAATVLVMLGLAAPASANHHLVTIAEVFPGTAAAPNSEYVQLEMTSSGQNFFGGTDSTVTLFDADGGTPTHTELLSGDVANGQRGRRVLVGVVGLDTTFGSAATPDYLFNPGDHLSAAGGAACFKPDDSFGASFVDCVSWGNFSGTTPSATGGNTSSAGITASMAVRRNRVQCESDLIDTNAPSDWSEATPVPLNNASLPATGCPDTTITKAPRKRGTDRTPKVKFEADPAAGATFECRVDDKPFASCESPHTTKRLSFGKHTFRVFATGPGGDDPTPAKAGFRVVRP